MPPSARPKDGQPLRNRLLALLQEVRASEQELARLAHKLRVAKATGRPLVIDRTRRQMAAREADLASLEAELRQAAPALFSAAQCRLPAGERVVRRRANTGAIITLHGGGDDGRCRLTIEGIGLPEPLDIHCSAQNVNLIGTLLAEALAGARRRDDDQVWTALAQRRPTRSVSP